MKIITKTLFLLFLNQFVFSQANYEHFDSYKLGEKRELKIQLPRNYDPDSPEKHPLVIVLDADYLFEPVVGNIDFQSYWEDMPGCIVVGINQSATRTKDLSFSEEHFMPSQDGATFFEFLSMELLPYIDDKFKTTSFRIIIGHDLSANFINYYLFKDKPLFDAYIVLSPDFAPKMQERLLKRLSWLDEEIFYYLATSDADVKILRDKIIPFNKELEKVSNQKFHYYFDDFKEADHYSLVSRGIPKGFNDIFSLFRPINLKEYKEEILTYEGTPYDYLMDKYKKIDYFYGYDKKISENDIRAIAAACKDKNDMDSLEKLSNIAHKTYPESMIGAYYKGLYFESTGNLKKALQRYQSGLLLKSSQYLNKDILLEKIYSIQE
ncbi:alpha/beta hydrolase [Mangrovimonas aestuarii]|uniref:alpha/beta hydrolase n=1 Tax=Mangrovimonas aestuarii TaxID=3018443 RepID=UPI002377D4D1|nr:alpha/beta hydrolase-fold protein [Mangrovimonas aestuarii]